MTIDPSSVLFGMNPIVSRTGRRAQTTGILLVGDSANASAAANIMIQQFCECNPGWRVSYPNPVGYTTTIVEGIPGPPAGNIPTSMVSILMGTSAWVKRPAEISAVKQATPLGRGPVSILGTIEECAFVCPGASCRGTSPSLLHTSRSRHLPACPAAAVVSRRGTSVDRHRAIA